MGALKRRYLGGAALLLVTVGFAAGCSVGTAGSDPTLVVPSATATSYVYVDGIGPRDLSEVLPNAQYVAHVRPVSVRYEVYQAPEQIDPSPGIDPVSGTPYPPYVYTPAPSPWTITTMEVVDVWLGDLTAGQTIEVSQFGGYLDGTRVIEDGVPQLADYADQDLAILLFRYDPLPDGSLINPYYVCASLELGVWSMNGNGNAGKLRLLSSDLVPTHQGNGPGNNGNGPGNNSGNGADFTVAQLKKLLADL